MTMKIYKPTTPARRGMTGIDFSQLTKKKAEKKLLIYVKRNVGRSASTGRITVRHKGGGVKKLYRIIEFAQTRIDSPAQVIALEYDPNRTGFIALIEYVDKQRQYIIAPHNLKVNDLVVFADKADLNVGNRMRLKNIPVGTLIYNVELEPGKGGIMVRSAGSSAQVLAHEEKYANLKMPSGEIRKVPSECFASIGAVSNPENRFYRVGKAGKSRLKGRRPHVRGTAMNPVDHPHGGGEGRQPIGLKYPKTPWGKHALGVKTRKAKKWSSKLIIQRRKKKIKK
ncbi:MAG: 50S ribosomal protein L2 [Candidatus Staskawiczbacteria bacterium RIFOXYB2_FULL_32_9]|uniref:Large ribosomal subunit protein uL2 n=1 Tax=Candidatus Staskawiczbacteria bacterium RIFOXYD1_FULL_32_13 TaxID=1802234 RepID=A0A1G2JL01_9BACT|nr:MAG: 50S ribosomal protein L2 [Candidatus Staskawiczbacteria bacterium RIFOXYB1_FULL_32_11]OGZ80899.1 MAG: 50S ribosomal protein L2 [Candidatus Staskawiczbacteria bacterium RIFOXYA2_FULL_32_7]OGZ82969.1 MAG: 50S ribosomal protein L2 [Candidatus Staskawiczbacteria bacterium RIFOXYB2_FULL_32_9]OGZ87799.1 MAG: 50S ribosomal protein L2 [Candidatus Staskawiczbacteria bacterium RIFOXYD1_FULL_32_13]OGZ88272.1 MAG: 50S ribosomal protein L2 [Candidatus Staskawiczbacteria bacterium RIFOXYC2_FULL_32_10